MKTIEIKHRWTGAILYSTEVEDDDENPIRTAVVRANLDGANLDGANLDGANLVGASLDGASLDGANLVGASLDGASLDGASLVGASLDGARLDGASLVGANLDPIRDDIWDVLDKAPDEVPGLLAALNEGRVDGSCYEGECACLVGTIANVRGVKYTDLLGIHPSAGRPAERWFLAIKRGHTPDNHPVAAITHDWIVQWQSARGEGDLLVEDVQP